jgi:hypothetical protein
MEAVLWGHGGRGTGHEKSVTIFASLCRASDTNYAPEVPSQESDDLLPDARSSGSYMTHWSLWAHHVLSKTLVISSPMAEPDEMSVSTFSTDTYGAVP